VARLKVNINPDILIWAREEAGYSIDEIAQKMNMSITDYSQWESKGIGLPFRKLKKVANYYKRQIATFFLPKVPNSLKKPNDYRNLSSHQSQLSKKVLLVMRRVAKFRDFALENKGQRFWNEEYHWLDEELQTFSEQELFSFLREILEISIEKQLQFASPFYAYKHWRTAIENKLGILIFQFPMPMEEVQGFCYSDTKPYSIVINSKNSYNGRIFTLFHELAHILQNQSGICTPDSVAQNQALEYKCNSFAGKFLVPSEYVTPADNLNEIKAFSNKFNISREVYLRRLLEEKLIEKNLYFRLLTRIKNSYKKTKTGGGPIKPTVKSKAQRGEAFYNMVLDSLHNNQISYSYASELLGLKLNSILSEV